MVTLREGAKLSRGHLALWTAEWMFRGMDEEATVWISVRRLDRQWRRSGLYIARRASNRDASKDRYQRIDAWMREGRGPLWMSDVHYNNGEVGFTDGRHRFAWMRDHGALALPVTTSISHAHVLQQYFGTRRRECRVFFS